LLSAWKDIKSANVIDEGGYEKERFSDITTKQLEILVQDILRKAEINLNNEFRRKRENSTKINNTYAF